jgi:acetyltransferase
MFDAERVAVVGATDREGSIGAAILRNLLADFDGDVLPVNPNVERVFGRPCHDGIEETDADLAIVVVPAEVVLEVVEDAGKAGLENLVIITAGFRESGDDGTTREAELKALAEKYDLDIVGPNSLGIISTSSGLNATFAPRNAISGRMSFMSQSGALVTAILEWAGDRNFGFKDVVSLGNKAVLDEVDFVETWGDDPDTDVVLGYLEGIESGTEFVETARAVTR